MGYYTRVLITTMLVLSISIFAIIYTKLETYIKMKFGNGISTRTVYWFKLILILIIEILLVIFISHNIQWNFIDGWFMCSFLFLAVTWIGSANRSMNSQGTKQFAKFLGADIHEEKTSEKVFKPSTSAFAIGTYVFSAVGIVVSFVYYKLFS